MLTDLTFLDKGNTFPPLAERERIADYEENRLLYQGVHSNVFMETLQRISRNEMTAGFPVHQYEIMLDYFKKVSLKTADICVGEPVSIIAGSNKEADKNQMDFVQDLYEASNLNDMLYKMAIDNSRYGSAVFNLTKTKEGKPILKVMPVKNWYPVCSHFDIHEVTHHVFCFPYKQGDKSFLQSFIYHEGGKVEKITSKLENGMIGAQLETEIVDSGFEQTIFFIHNVNTSDDFYGQSDYDGFQSIVAELEVRFAQVSKILDKHSAPSMQGPRSVLKADEKTEERYFEAGQFYCVDKDGIPVSYLTWDANLQANFTQIEKLKEELLTHSEMGVLFDTSKIASVASGSALKRMLMNVLAKTNRVKASLVSPLKQAIKAAAKSTGIEIDNLQIMFQDGLPNDLLEDAQIESIRTGNKPTSSVKAAIMRIDGSDEQGAEEEYQTMLDEQSEMDGMMAGGYTSHYNRDDPPDDPEEG
ncbi:MAG: phage portal protein [Clostridiales bacterium]|nr:phage portal protein [Clostridiales bacterium]